MRYKHVLIYFDCLLQLTRALPTDSSTAPILVLKGQLIIAVLPFMDTLLESLAVVVEVAAQVPQFFVLGRKLIAMATAMPFHVLWEAVIPYRNGDMQRPQRVASHASCIQSKAVQNERY